jgi:predicted nucleic acid-binding protein
VKYFFDSSVLVPALLSEHEHHAPSFSLFAAATPKRASCAAHSLAEVYATLTRYPGRERLNAEQAALLVEQIERRFELIWLDGQEYWSAIKGMAAKGIVGATVYDGLIAACAVKSRALRLYTWNARHFDLLGEEVKKLVARPPAA